MSFSEDRSRLVLKDGYSLVFGGDLFDKGVSTRTRPAVYQTSVRIAPLGPTAARRTSHPARRQYAARGSWFGAARVSLLGTPRTQQRASN